MAAERLLIEPEFVVETDNKTLVSLLSSKNLEELLWEYNNLGYKYSFISQLGMCESKN